MSPTPVGRTAARKGRQIVEGPGNRVVTILLALSLSLSGEKMIPFAQVAPGRPPFRGDISCQKGTLYSVIQWSNDGLD